jgi:hypothetical protein
MWVRAGNMVPVHVSNDENRLNDKDVGATYDQRYCVSDSFNSWLAYALCDLVHTGYDTRQKY